MKKKVKLILAGIVLLTIAAVVFLSITQPLAVDAIEISPTYAEAYFTERGVVREDRIVDVFSLVSGKILSVSVKEDQTISEGDVIAIVDSSDFRHEIELIKVKNKAILAQIDNLEAEEARTRESQRTDRNALQGELSSLNAQEQMARTSITDQQQAREENIRLQNILIGQSQRDVQNAEVELERANTLFDVGAISKTELEAAEQTLEDLKTELAANEQKLAIINSETSIDQSSYYYALKSSVRAKINNIDTALEASYSEPMRQYYQAQIESGDLEIDNLERLVSNSIITSHVSGTITHLHVDSTNVVNGAMPVASIRTETENLIRVLVSTQNIDDIKVGDGVVLTFTRQSEDLVLKGTIHRIDDRAEAMISVLGVEERRVEVLIEPDISSERLRSGFDVDVRFTTYASDNKVVVPRMAVFEAEGQSMVYLVQNGNAVATPVKLGTWLQTDVVVESGVVFGDVVIRNARQNGLGNGFRVKY